MKGKISDQYGVTKAEIEVSVFDTKFRRKSGRKLLHLICTVKITPQSERAGVLSENSFSGSAGTVQKQPSRAKTKQPASVGKKLMLKKTIPIRKDTSRGVVRLEPVLTDFIKEEILPKYFPGCRVSGEWIPQEYFVLDSRKVSMYEHNSSGKADVYAFPGKRITLALDVSDSDGKCGELEIAFSNAEKKIVDSDEVKIAKFNNKVEAVNFIRRSLNSGAVFYEKNKTTPIRSRDISENYHMEKEARTTGLPREFPVCFFRTPIWCFDADITLSRSRVPVLREEDKMRKMISVDEQAGGFYYSNGEKRKSSDADSERRDGDVSTAFGSLKTAGAQALPKTQVTATFKNVRLKDCVYALNSLIADSGWKVEISPNVDKSKYLISAKVQAKTILKTLDACFEDTDLAYEIRGKVIMITSKADEQGD